MPIMPRTSSKCQKIAEDVLGKKKKSGSDKAKDSKKEQRLTVEETSKQK